MAAALTSTFYFMEKDPLHLVEKPYELNYEPQVGQPRTNMTINPVKDLSVTDIRNSKSKYSFDKHGFEVVNIDSPLTHAEYDDETKVIGAYFSKVAEVLKRFLGAERVQVFDYTARSRGVLHVPDVRADTTPQQTRKLIERMSPNEAETLLKKRHQYINVWKPLRGPVDEWPLALCDPSSVEKSDYIARDYVEVDSFIETYHLYQRASQKWYYLSNQTEQEAWVFLQSDSKPGSKMGVPHCSIPVRQDREQKAILRESIEVRVLAFYDEE
ncbi:CmcJ-like methyltransferase [Blumeria hordei DH14]|uniref:CmcJ-like methyltransferase n=1 Tax=Blumeria graminis f. sp. hordei (strain DH14) TaxID=546991 RepID=N1JE24_BLUG1|nr:CmcJ-like methyltransferase [Blumeria hordei DH14]